MAKQDPLRDSKAFKEFTTEHDRKFRMMVEDLRSRGVDDMREIKDVLKHQLENDTTLAGMRTQLSRKRKKIEDDRHKQVTRNQQEEIKETNKLAKAVNQTGKSLDQFAKGAKERSKIFATTLRQGLVSDLGTLLGPLQGISQIPILGTVVKSIGASLSINAGLEKIKSKMTGKTIEIQKETAESMNSMEQMTQDLVDMVGKIMNHMVGGPTPSEQREMDLEKRRGKKEDPKPGAPGDGATDKAGGLFGGGGLMGILGKVFGKGGLLAMGLGLGKAGLMGAFGLAKGGLGFILKGLLSGPGGVIAAALGGFFAGKALYDNFLGPFLEDMWLKQREAAAKKMNENRFAGKGERGQTTIETAAGKEELAFTVIDEEGNAKVVGETEAKAMAKKMGYTMEEAKALGIVKKKTFTTDKTGKTLSGKKHIGKGAETEAATKEAQEKRDIKFGTDDAAKFGLSARTQAEEQSNLIQSLIDEHGLDSMKVRGHLLNDTIPIMMRMLGGAARAKVNIDDILGNWVGAAGSAGHQGGGLVHFAATAMSKLNINKPDDMKKRIENAITAGANDMNVLPANIKNKILKALKKGKMPALAKGGLVSNAMFGMLGEAGPELVMPLDKSAETIGAILASALKQTPMGMIPDFGNNGLDPMLGDDLNQNQILKMPGRLDQSRTKGGGGATVVAPNNSVTNQTSVLSVNNAHEDHPSFMRERKEQMDHLLWM